MARKKPNKSPLPEVETLLEGMQDLLTDEYGNPLPPQHPHVQKLSNLLQRINATHGEAGDSEFPESPQGTA